MPTKILNRIDKLFENKKDSVLSVYFTAGFPKLEDTSSIIQYLEEAGTDIVEIGVPFSDPVADGPTIQDSNQIALENGMSMKLLFEQIKEIRKSVQIPLVLMGYLNPVMQFGAEEFCKKCEECGIDGLIIPDLPIQQYIEEYKPLFDRYGLFNVFLISPQTSEERIRYIDQNSSGFIYMVSSAAITGAKKGISDEQLKYFSRINEMKLHNPTLIGFGISDHDSFKKASKYSSGAIIGSAFINLIKESKNLKEDIKSFIAKVKGV